MRNKIEAKLMGIFGEDHVKVVDVSQRHKGHMQDAHETHFEVSISSSLFSNLSPLKKHQMVYAILSEEMKTIHSLSLKLSVAPTS